MNSTSLTTWHAALDHFQRIGAAHVLATQVTAMGSTPREPGARMVITPECVIDTLGGGAFEWQTIELARRYLAEGKTGFHLEAFSLGGRSGQCCGGYVNILLEVFPGSASHLIIFGAGHVGQHIVSLSAPLPWQRHWFDSRTTFLQPLAEEPRLDRVLLSDITGSVRTLPACSHVIVATHSHDEDYALVKALIERSDLGSIGLIGSESKWSSFQGRLQRAGYSAEQIERVRCPIGAVGGAKFHDKTPYAIALSVVTELLWLTDIQPPTSNRGLDSSSLRPLFHDSSQV
ncbi:xanthine dehydrogenase accessory protein XdhC [Vreelandella sp. EE22]